MTEQISDLYQSGLSIREVGGTVDRSTNCVRKRLIKNGVPRRSTGEVNRKYSCNEAFFETIDSGEKAYWVGFLAADGCILDKRSLTLRFALAIKDVNMVEKLKGALEANCPIHHGFRKMNGKVLESVRFSIRSKKLCDDLIDKGVVPRKSLILKPPKNIPKNLISHWIRGYFDGDGNVHLTKRKYKTVSISGTKEVLRFIQGCLEGIGHIHSRKSKAFGWAVGSREDVRKFSNYIYRDATVYLGRKKLVFQNE